MTAWKAQPRAGRAGARRRIRLLEIETDLHARLESGENEVRQPAVVTKALITGGAWLVVPYLAEPLLDDLIGFEPSPARRDRPVGTPPAAASGGR